MLPPKQQQQQTQTERSKSSASYFPPHYLDKNSVLQSNGADFPLAEPPLEYLNHNPDSEIPKKPLLPETSADVKRGILSSFLEKVSWKK